MVHNEICVYVCVCVCTHFLFSSYVFHKHPSNAAQEGVKTLCAAVPGIEIAPLGAGIEAKPDNICDQAQGAKLAGTCVRWGLSW